MKKSSNSEKSSKRSIRLGLTMLLVTAAWAFYSLIAVLSEDFLISLGIMEEWERYAIIAFGLLTLVILIGKLVGIRKDKIIKDFVK